MLLRILMGSKYTTLKPALPPNQPLRMYLICLQVLNDGSIALIRSNRRTRRFMRLVPISSSASSSVSNSLLAFHHAFARFHEVSSIRSPPSSTHAPPGILSFRALND